MSPWAKVDDTLHSHPKAMQAGLPALGLHLLAMSYSAGYLTDGFVPDGWVEREQGRTKGLPDRLVEAGMWHRIEGGYIIHDWLDYNPSKAEVNARREARAEAGRKGGLRKRAASNGSSGSKANA